MKAAFKDQCCGESKEKTFEWLLSSESKTTRRLAASTSEAENMEGKIDNMEREMLKNELTDARKHGQRMAELLAAKEEQLVMLKTKVAQCATVK